MFCVKFTQKNAIDRMYQFNKKKGGWGKIYMWSLILKFVWNWDFWINTNFVLGLHKANQIGSEHWKKNITGCDHHPQITPPPPKPEGGGGPKLRVLTILGNKFFSSQANIRNTFFNQSSSRPPEVGFLQWNGRTDIATLWLNWPWGRFSENYLEYTGE